VKLKGSITMPGLVHRTGLASATQRMERTIGDNIASPLVMRFSDTVASLFMASRTPLPMGASDSRMLTDGMTHGDE
jgi:hypothetical protein